MNKKWFAVYWIFIFGVCLWAVGSLSYHMGETNEYNSWLPTVTYHLEKEAQLEQVLEECQNKPPEKIIINTETIREVPVYFEDETKIKGLTERIIELENLAVYLNGRLALYTSPSDTANITAWQAISYLQDARYTHAWLLANPTHINAYTGDADYQRMWVNRYNAVIKILSRESD